MLINNELLKNKFKAAGIHFSISLLIFFVMAIWFCFYLYPSFYFSMSGGIQGLMLMLFCDAVLGPLLTLIVFNNKKPRPEILIDLGIIACVQLAALIYGLYAVYHGRPYVIGVYPNDSGVVLPYADVVEDEAIMKADMKKFSTVKRVPIGFIGTYDNEYKIVPINKDIKRLSAADKLSRDYINNLKADKDANAKEVNFVNNYVANVKSDIKKYEDKYKKIYLVFVSGKYQGAYFIFDENAKYLDMIGKIDLEMQF